MKGIPSSTLIIVQQWQTGVFGVGQVEHSGLSLNLCSECIT